MNGPEARLEAYTCTASADGMMGRECGALVVAVLCSEAVRR